MRIILFSAAVGAALLAGCSSTPKPSTPAPIQAQTTQAAPTTTATATARPVDDATLQSQRMAERQRQIADLNAQSVFFDFDDFSVKPDFTTLLQKQADFLKSTAGDHLTLQGSSDERGGIEYNLALGQKRADAVRRALVLLGAPEDRIETISFGEEKPRATCHEESCWSQNRRVDFSHAEPH